MEKNKKILTVEFPRLELPFIRRVFVLFSQFVCKNVCTRHETLTCLCLPGLPLSHHSWLSKKWFWYVGCCCPVFMYTGPLSDLLLDLLTLLASLWWPEMRCRKSSSFTNSDMGTNIPWLGWHWNSRRFPMLPFVVPRICGSSWRWLDRVRVKMNNWSILSSPRKCQPPSGWWRHQEDDPTIWQWPGGARQLRHRPRGLRWELEVPASNPPSSIYLGPAWALKTLTL